MNPQRVLNFLRKRPGSTCEEIARALGEKPTLVTLALRELRAAARVESIGKTRGTRWSETAA